MTRRLIATLACTLALTGGVLAGATPAGACSCIEPPPTVPFAFTGTAIEVVEPGDPPLWRFRTDAELRGDVGPGPLVAVSIPLEGSEDTGLSDACYIDQAPLVLGGRYRVEAAGSATDGNGIFHVNLCGGAVTPISGSPSVDVRACSEHQRQERCMITASASGLREQIILVAVSFSGLVAGLVFFLRRLRRGK